MNSYENDRRPPHEILASHIQRQPVDPNYNPYRTGSTSYQNYHEPISQNENNPYNLYHSNSHQSDPYLNPSSQNENRGNDGYTPINPYLNRTSNQTYSHQQRYNESERY